MRKSPIHLLLVVALCPLLAGAQETSPQAKPPDKKAEKPRKDEALKTPDLEAELQNAIEESGNDRAALVRNLENYLKRFPDAPSKAAVYRALVQALVQLNDQPRALGYAERLIALRPEDTGMMLFAVDLLERAGDDHSLVKAVGYISRVLERVEKNPQDQKSPRVSPEEWELERKKLRMSIYLIRGRLEMRRKNYDAAVADLEKSYQTLPNTPAALRLGEIAELRKQNEQAIEHYVNAYALPESYGTEADRRDARRKLGNLWQLAHGSETGLGDKLLGAYDRFSAESAAGVAPERNAGIADPFAMDVRRLSGPALKLAETKGKVLVLNFWATWCGPCRELEPLIETANQKYTGNADVVFLAANRDEDETLVAPFVQREKVRGTVVFADGLERVLRVRALPTVIVLDRTGKIVYRAEGYGPEGFLETLCTAIDQALAAK